MMGYSRQKEQARINRRVDIELSRGVLSHDDISTLLGVNILMVVRRSQHHRPEGSTGIEKTRRPAKSSLDVAFRRFEECSNKLNHDAMIEAQKTYLASFK